MEKRGTSEKSQHILFEIMFMCRAHAFDIFFNKKYGTFIELKKTYKKMKSDHTEQFFH